MGACLVDALGYAPGMTTKEANLPEHALSEQLRARLAAQLGELDGGTRGLRAARHPLSPHNRVSSAGSRLPPVMNTPTR